MNSDLIKALEDRHQIPTYAKVPIAIERGDGPYVWDADGNRYIDFYGGHCVSILGHSPPAVTDAIAEQAKKLMFYSNIVYNSTRAKAAKRVADLSPEGFSQVFFCNSGTEANETALKIARKATGRDTVLAMEGGFHGRTLGSLGATHGEKYRAAHSGVLAPSLFVPFGDIEAADRALSQEPDIAAVILEPIQSMAGMKTADAEYFQQLQELCCAHGSLLIFDEVQTGCGRTGQFSYSEIVGVTPALITMAKSLGSGVPVGATIVHDSLTDSIDIGDQGSTFGGGMLAMAAVDATLAVIQAENLQSRALDIEKVIRGALAPFAVEIRGAGCLLGVELSESASAIVASLREHGVLVGGSGHPNTIRLMPPVNCPDSALHEALDILTEVLSKIDEKSLVSH
jgi:acetylornithine/succinyldiaminopimelate/putrescine aminotransferase